MKLSTNDKKILLVALTDLDTRIRRGRANSALTKEAGVLYMEHMTGQIHESYITELLNRVVLEMEA